MIKLKTIIAEAKDTKAKIKRDAFVYLDPKGEKVNFAQCATCRMFTGESCSILGKMKITPEMSCDLYVHGTPSKSLKGKEVASYTPKEVGLVNRKVRCENCRSFNKGQCMFYNMLNKKMPDIFDLDESVSSNSCCNAQMPK